MSLMEIQRQRNAKLLGITPREDRRTPRGNRIVDLSAHDSVQEALRMREVKSLGFGQRTGYCG